jgi:hypothetical protein
MTTYDASSAWLAEGNGVQSAGTGRDERAGEGLCIGAGRMCEDDSDNVRKGRSNERTSLLRPLFENKMYFNNTCV